LCFRQKIGGRFCAIHNCETNFIDISAGLFQTSIANQFVAGVEDHVHLLFGLARTSALSEVVKEVKRGSSIWIKTKSADLSDFAWQNGYGAFSVGFSQIETVRAYIMNQEEHHPTASFQDELRTLLRRYRIEFDERYVWD
jgi:putative transposase